MIHRLRDVSSVDGNRLLLLQATVEVHALGLGNGVLQVVVVVGKAESGLIWQMLYAWRIPTNLD